MGVPFDLLEVAGSYREIGRQTGEGARPLVERRVALFEADFERFAGLPLAAAEALTRPLLAAAERRLPQYVEELRGLAEGAVVPFSRVLLLNCGEELTCTLPPEPGHCTSLALAGEGRTIVAHNEDWEEQDIEHQLLLRVTVPDGTRILAMTTAGLLAMTGLNSHGLAFGANTVYARDEGADALPSALRPGVPDSLVCRWMLEAPTRGEATARALLSERARGSNHLCGQAGGRIWDVETSASRASVIEGGAVTDDWEWLAHTNHYLAAEMLEVEGSTSAGSRLRYARACELLSEGLGPGVDPVGLAGAVLRDHANAPTSICGHGGEGPDAPSPTTASMVWELEERRMHVCAGPPCANPYRVIALA
ncbi:MAG TPA: C45 family peptidase [Thermoleophilia bacterium]|nr:C45 family peptidase [Thermoleophilia bacterium]